MCSVLECFEMAFNSVNVLAVDQGGFIDLTDPFVLLLMDLCRIERTLYGVLANWF